MFNVILTKLKTPFSWKTCKKTPLYLYQENSITGKRRVRLRGPVYGYQPFDHKWLLNED